ncbi:hypothetical protein WJX81_007383 [Elliptochloris bilobata]|uniref:Uncharacterized protein n=1 Tax=Elliptochloris bilobata TaxID=381761 RepID=A0AAW1RBU3_9CHLO
MGERGWESFQGLNAILESQRWPIAKKCQAVDSCLDLNRDNLRGFFEQCFSLLLKQIFGFDGSSWLYMIAKGAAEMDTRALVALVAPEGKLFGAMQSADSDAIIQFSFPLERLPTHTQLLLASEAGRAELERWPQYRGRLLVDGAGRAHVRLLTFQYFLFWFAFYVLRSGQAAAEPARARGGRLLAPSLGAVKKTLRLTRGARHLEGHPYLRLLRRYLDHFLPLPDRPPASAGGGGAGGAATTRALARDARPEATRGQVLLAVLTELWLSDGDEPLPDVAAPAGASEHAVDKWGTKDAIAPLRAVSYEAPESDLVEALIVLVRYAVAREDPGDASAPLKPALAGPAAWLPPGLPLRARAGAVPPPARLGAAGSPAAQALAARLYRFLSRALQQWPEQRSLRPIVSLWCAYLAPWWPPPAAGAADAGATGWLAAPSAGAGGGERLARELQHVTGLVHQALGDGHAPPRGGEDAVAGRYTREWQAHVLANLPFYELLLPRFLALTRARVSSQGDTALADVLKVLTIFKAAPELVELLAGVEAGYCAFAAHPARRPEGAHAELLPFLADQALDWEATAAARCAGAPLPAAVPALRLLDRGDQGGAALAREVLQAAKGAVREELLAETAAVAAAVLPMRELGAAEPAAAPATPAPAERVQGLRRGTWRDVAYKGDRMRRPIASNEIGWLVRLLLAVSDCANARLGLGTSLAEGEAAPSADAPALQRARHWLRKWRWRVNLRPLAEVSMADLNVEDVKKMKVQELRDALEARGLDTSGLKAALVERLEAAMGGAAGPTAEDGAPGEEPVAEEEAAPGEEPAAVVEAPAEPAAAAPVAEVEPAAEPAYEAAPGVDAGAAAEAVYQPPPAEVAQPPPAAVESVAVGNNKRKAEEHEEEHMRKRASFNGPAEGLEASDPANGAATRATGFSDAPPAGAAYQLFSAPQPAVEAQAAPAPAMQASQAGFTDVVDIPAGMVGKLIGKGGETIKQLQYSTQTKIQIDHMTSGDVKKVSITGSTAELVEAAKAQVMGVVAGDERGGEAQNTVECPQGIVGRIIGRGGETIRALQQASQAHIVVDQNYPEGQPRRVNISGRPDAVERATKMVSELIAGEPGSAQSIIQKYGAGITREVACPKSMVGRVIGKGGETIKALQKNFGANIQIDQSTEPMKVTVSGQPQAVELALGAVQEIINGGSPYLGPGSGGFDGTRGGGGGGGGFGAAASYGAPQYPAAAAGGFGYGGFPAQAAAGPAGAYGYGYGGYAQPYAAPQAAYGAYGGYGATDPYAAAAAGGYGAYGGAASGGAASGGGGGSTWQEVHDGEGRPYYYNTQSGVSQWEKPADMA